MHGDLNRSTQILFTFSVCEFLRFPERKLLFAANSVRVELHSPAYERKQKELANCRQIRSEHEFRDGYSGIVIVAWL